MRNSLHRLSQMIQKIEEMVITFCLGMVCIVILIQILGRNLNFAAGWAGEVAMFFSCWMTYLGASLAVKQGTHFSVDLFMGKSSLLLTVMDIVAKLTVVFFVFYLVWQGFFMTYLVRLRVSGIADISMGFYFVALPISAVFMIIHMLDAAVNPAFAKSE